jgi:hypothetical protein
MRREGWRDTGAFRGGCQCGAVRYAVAPGRSHASVCHCRMCQRATGNAFAPLILVEGAVIWTGTPSEWASSAAAVRGFCAACGTPLYMRDSDGLQLMAGTIAPPSPFAPVENDGVEARVGWLVALAALPDDPTPLADPPIASRQWPEEA